jgi:hypothetical protein
MYLAGGDAIVRHNRFTASSGGGEAIRWDRPPATARIDDNVFEGGGRYLFLLFGRAPSGPGLTGNAFGDAALHVELYDHTADVDARGNFWGPVATAEMDTDGPDADIASLRDVHDDFTLGRVDYAGWLAAPPAGAGP